MDTGWILIGGIVVVVAIVLEFSMPATWRAGKAVARLLRRR